MKESKGLSAEDSFEKIVEDMTIQRKRIFFNGTPCVICKKPTGCVFWNQKDDEWYECCSDECLKILKDGEDIK